MTNISGELYFFLVLNKSKARLEKEADNGCVSILNCP